MRKGLFAAAAALLGCAFGLSVTAADAVTLISDARLTLPEFAAKAGQDPNLFETRYAATGMVICNGTYSTAQLTVRNNLVTTAAHAFFDARGKSRGDLSQCEFTIAIGGQRHKIAIDADTLRVGSRDPYAVSPVHDWAVVRLAEDVPGAEPYALGTPGPVGTSVFMLAHRHRGWVHDGSKAIEACAIRIMQAVDAKSAREIAIDCSAGEGASGSAIMLQGSTRAMIGIYIGWRSTHPETSGPFSSTHMNFGVAIEGPFRDAILAAAANDTAPPAAPPTQSAHVAPAAALH